MQWEQANRRKRWAYTSPAPGERRGRKYNPKVADIAALYSEINALSRRIELGKKMIDDLPFDHPKRIPWRSHLNSLYQQRKRLRNL